MPRIPARFIGFFHPQARRSGNSLRISPAASPIVPVSISSYQRKITGVPLTGGQAVAKAGGTTLTLSVGPQGLGTVWYPTQITVSTSIGPLDTAVALVYLGPAQQPNTLQFTIYTGNGTGSLAIPSMTPGQTIAVAWTGLTAGETCSVNVTGTMDALGT